MKIPLRAPRALLALLALGSLLLAADLAHAGDPRTGRIDIEARLDPEDLGPGDSGMLIVEGTLLPKLHIYAKGDQAMQIVPVEAAGVTYHMQTMEFTEPHVFRDEMGDAFDVWEESFVFKVKVTLAADVAPGTKLGLSFTYWGCNDRGCYQPVRNHAATVAVAGSNGSALAGDEPAVPGDVVADAGPRLVQGPLHREGTATLAIDEEKGEAVVTFAPSFGWHMYGSGGPDGYIEAEVEPQESEGVTWGEFENPKEAKIRAPVEVRIPFERGPDAKELILVVRWQACEDDEELGTCESPRKETLRAVWGGAEVVETPPVAAPPVREGDIRFPVVDDDDIEGGDDSKATSWLEGNLLTSFGLLFLLGLGLAFTPCVLPIIPITVSVISGGNADIPKKRLAALLLTYVAGLALAFATMGVVAALAGGSMSTIFAMPEVQWGIAILFILLAFGMLGIYELQPPAWMTNLLGGAQKHSGSFVGAFLFGVLGAVIASPCTAPAIAGLLIETAKTGNVVLGFFLFLTLGLGMGTVLFAVGSLNFALKPGPWMVWVRYAFGAMLIGVALYYLAGGALIDQKTLFIVGFALAALAWIGVAWHLTTKEGEEKGPARMRGAQVAIVLILVTGFVGLITRRPDNLLEWTYAKDPDHMVELVAQAKAEGKPAVVDFWGTWCYYCKKYDRVIAATPELRERFEQIVRIKVDLPESDERWDMRHAVGLEAGGAPHLIFLDRQGRIRRNADVTGWIKPEELKARVDLVLKSAAAKP